MARHDLLPGCTSPWKHDCEGFTPSSLPDGFDGIICHCPCHPLTEERDALRSENERLRVVLRRLVVWLPTDPAYTRALNEARGLAAPTDQPGLRGADGPVTHLDPDEQVAT